MVKEENKSMKVNLRVKDENLFYSNESSINLNPNEIILDFKCITHAQDLQEHRGLILRHNLVILNPFHAKSFLIMLNKAVKNYEAKFGEIKKPESMKKAEKLVKKESQKDKKLLDKVKDKAESYFG